jgi:deaminated glutathione amidase
MIVNPWGEVLAEMGGREEDFGIAAVEVDLEFLERVRREMPLLRRTYVTPSCLRLAVC